ncbi:hypothetical protein TRFO_32072 [Tritrichomonas foetus]|uniref:Uncharacterized protein n=1 Tax=Tritrichomonas foetus TaxID=1144522 RepID=A0A1J4JUJ1_9EUKA|nr:hypothetical protein TRFO_32072 [Tritrichomonas foetus]|eukprot:OHT01188.1 hypothetical protein TRFO_32072 [Tritrichomonas foetus]
MSSTIKNLHEITGRPLLRERHLACSSPVTGLGPDDLVVIDKQEKAFLQMPIIVFSYHQVCGFSYDDPNLFSKYFEDLINRQEKGSYLPFTKTYKITKGRIFTYNSFTKNDICITALPGKKECSVRIQNKEEIQLTDETWRQIKICTILRYYRASQPLLYSLFGSRIVRSFALRVFKINQNLSYDDFCYCVENHSLTDEFVSSFASGLLISLTTQEITAFIFHYQQKLPTLFYHLARFISPKCEFSSVFYPLLENHTDLFCDDLDTIIPLAKYLFVNNRITECKKFQPLFINSIWSSPQCALFIANLAIRENNVNKALVYLNTACYAKNWPSTTFDVRAPTVNKVNHEQKFNNPMCEARVINSPLIGVNSDYIKTVYKIIQFPDFQKIWDEFCNNKKYGISQRNYMNWPSNNFEITETKNKEELYLFDPGVEINNPDYEYLKTLPIAPYLNDAIKDTKSMLSKRNDFINREFDSKTEMFNIILLALRIDDQELLKKCFVWGLNNEISGIEKMLFIYAKISGADLDMNSLSNIIVKMPTQTEENVLIFLDDIAKAFSKLNKTPKAE